MSMQRIFLLGYMGAGKTTLGKALAERLGLTFVDLDLFIEARQHKTVSQLFAAVGEEGFRALERRALAEVATYEDVVVALGGGTPCFFDNMDLARRAGVTVWLRPTEDVLVRRLMEGRAKRPILAAMQSEEELRAFVRRQSAQREPTYRRAHITLGSSHLESREEIAEAVRVLQEALQALAAAPADGPDAQPEQMDNR